MPITDPVTFLYPTKRLYPFDEVCDIIVRALEARHWNVPGITVTFWTNGRGAAWHRHVKTITGEDFLLEFNREQSLLLSGFYDFAAVETLFIPEAALRVTSHLPRAVYEGYEGNHWKRERDQFFQQFRESRYNRRASEASDKILARFTTYLEQVVLPMILAHPISDTPAEKLELVPFPESFGPLFCRADTEAIRRIQAGKADRTQQPAEERYALDDGGYRLAHLGLRRGKITVPQVAYDGFLWCGRGEITDQTSIEDAEVPGHFSWNEPYLVRVIPKWANRIFVADNSVYTKWREQKAKRIAPRTRFDCIEVDHAIALRAATIVPLTEYDGSFEDPIILIGRELDFDEVEIVSGPWPEWPAMQYITTSMGKHTQALISLCRRYRDFAYTREASSGKRNFAVFSAQLRERLERDEALTALCKQNRVRLGQVIERLIWNEP